MKPDTDFQTQFFNALAAVANPVPPSAWDMMEADPSIWLAFPSLLPGNFIFHEASQIQRAIENMHLEDFSNRVLKHRDVPALRRSPGAFRMAALTVIGAFRWTAVESADEAWRVFKALGDPQRQSMLRLIAARPRTGSEIARKLGLSKPSISRHVAQLRDAGLIDAQFRSGSLRLTLKRETLDGLTDLARRALRLGV